MFFIEAIVALLVALVLGLLLSAALGVRGPWAAPWALFLVIFLFVWAGGVWVTPFGPPVFDVYWMPFLLIGLFVMMLIAAGSERRPRVPAREAVEEARAEESAALGLSIFFWILVALLGAAVLVRYF